MKSDAVCVCIVHFMYARTRIHQRDAAKPLLIIDGDSVSFFLRDALHPQGALGLCCFEFYRDIRQW